ncbi:FtsJ-like methyltransferase-domain-containing protein [Syncephalis fuscata]|nr:FtsJ-like methyltransferase-domain-containing protein [Syncephalis fuscata]
MAKLMPSSSSSSSGWAMRRYLSTYGIAMAHSRSGSSNRWLQRQRDDIYARQARADGYRTRSAYKLLALHEKHRFLLPGCRCVDCGSSPGGWSQVAAELILRNAVKPEKPRIHYRIATPDTESNRLDDDDEELEDEGLVIAVDLLPMAPITGVHFIEGDFRTDEITQRMAKLLDDKPVDVVLSDMAPSLSGIRTVDQARSMELCEAALEFAQQHLRKEGTFICKVFMDGGDPTFRRHLQGLFRKVLIEKPMASRKDSAEIYFVCLGKQ